MSSPGSSPPPPADHSPEYDPLFLNSRREAAIIFFVWLAALLWAVPYCYLNGYVEQVDPETFSTTWGIPTWLFWGILVPWIVADLFTTWFCFCYMKDDDIGEAHEGADLAEEIAEMHAAENAAKQEGNS
ncbi:MAG: hypothetical protein Tsb009_15640 [Planctomycetaceae bacterium]